VFLDIAPFSSISREGNSAIFTWEEPRDVHHIGIDTARKIPRPLIKRVKVDYWQKNWPFHRSSEEDLLLNRIGQAAWKPEDDWFNGSWREADIRRSSTPRGLDLRFNALARKEYPDLKDYNVRHRRTLKLRVTLPPEVTAERIRILTQSRLKKMRICVELGCGLDARPKWNGKVEVYNGYLSDLRGPTEADPRLHLSVLCARPPMFSFDSTVITIRTSDQSFSFRPLDVLGTGFIWAPDLHVLVSQEDEDLLYERDRPQETLRGRSIYDKISDIPEQSLEQAMGDNPPKRPMHFIVGLEGRRQKFGVEPTGDVFAGIGYVRRVPGPDTEKISWDGKRLYLLFNWEDFLPNGRSLEGGYLPILRQRFSKGSLDIHEEVFATKLLGSVGNDPIRGEDPVIAMIHLTFENRGDRRVDVKQNIGFRSGERPLDKGICLNGDVVRCDGGATRASIDIREKGNLSAHSGVITYEIGLPPHARHSIVIKFPFIDLLTQDEVSALREKDWEFEHDEVMRYWQGRIAQGTQIHTGDQELDDFYRALLTHILINDDCEVGSDRIIGRVSSFNYGNYPNESIMQIAELDRRGFHDEARRHLETFLHYQGTAALPGNFQTEEGVFYGSGGYESGDYNQHHGWVLWGLAEHFRHSGDRKWFLTKAEKIISGFDWVIRERRATMIEGAQGLPVREYGYLPAGSLEDVKEYWYWLSTNCLTYRGVEAIAKAMKETGHPEATRLENEASRYREDLLRGIHESMVSSPLVRLGDGTYVPHVPSRLHRRGRDIGWIREVLEGSIVAVGTVLDPLERVSTWILKDFEDNRYVDAPFGYPLGDFEKQWFSLGGFSMQPNLVYVVSPYLLRDEIKHFLRAFFNAFSACWRRDIRSLTEHPLPSLSDWAGDHFKSSDESMVSYHLRLMFIQECDEDLYLGRALPRRWLAPGRTVWIRGASTHFGTMSLEIGVGERAETIIANLDLPERRSPRRILLRVRHPNRVPIRRVLVDGKPWMEFDVEKEWVVLPPMTGKVVVEFLYGPKAEQSLQGT